jgi:hypothetical protein
MGNNQMLSKFDAEITSLGRNQSLSKESLPYRLELRQHHTELEIKGQRGWTAFQISLCHFAFFFLFTVALYAYFLHSPGYVIRRITATTLP